MVKNVADDSALKAEQTAMNAITIDCVILDLIKGV